MMYVKSNHYALNLKYTILYVNYTSITLEGRNNSKDLKTVPVFISQAKQRADRYFYVHIKHCA